MHIRVGAIRLINGITVAVRAHFGKVYGGSDVVICGEFQVFEHRKFGVHALVEVWLEVRVTRTLRVDIVISAQVRIELRVVRHIDLARIAGRKQDVSGDAVQGVNGREQIRVVLIHPIDVGYFAF